MRKKIFAVALAAVMTVTSAISAFGAEEYWSDWLAANKAGVNCKVTASVKDGKATVVLENDGLISTTTVPVEGDVYVALSGEQCKLTDIKGIDGATELECGGFWSAHTPGVKLTESDTTVTFKSTTNADAKENWDTPVVVVFSASDGKVNGAEYKEYVVIRSDNYAWSGDINTGNIEAWEAAGNKIASEGVPVAAAPAEDESAAADTPATNDAPATNAPAGNGNAGNANTGDAAPYAVAVLAVAAAAVVVVLQKKKVTE